MKNHGCAGLLVSHLEIHAPSTLINSCIATRLLRTIGRLGGRKIRSSEIAVVDAAFLKA
jgi:hypothetical protein